MLALEPQCNETVSVTTKTLLGRKKAAIDCVYLFCAAGNVSAAETWCVLIDFYP